MSLNFKVSLRIGQVWDFFLGKDASVDLSVRRVFKRDRDKFNICVGIREFTLIITLSSVY